MSVPWKIAISVAMLVLIATGGLLIHFGRSNLDKKTKQERATHAGSADRGEESPSLRPPIGDESISRRISELRNSGELEALLLDINNSDLPEWEKGAQIIRLFQTKLPDDIEPSALYEIINRLVQQKTTRRHCLGVLGERLAGVSREEAERFIESITYADDIVPLALGHAIANPQGNEWSTANLLNLYSTSPEAVKQIGRGLGMQLRANEESVDFWETLQALDAVGANDGQRDGAWEFLRQATRTFPKYTFDQLMSEGQVQRLFKDEYIFSGWAAAVVTARVSEVSEVLSSPEIDAAHRGRIFENWIRSNEDAAATWFEENFRTFGDGSVVVAFASEFQDEARRRGDRESELAWADFIKDWKE
jgi:hypothetical protein